MASEESKTTPKPDGDAEALVRAIEAYSAAFDMLTQERHIAGAKEYGVVSFLGNDVIRMMMEELADTANYCRMQFIKLMLLQQMIEEDDALPKQAGTNTDTFKGAGEVGWHK